MSKSLIIHLVFKNDVVDTVVEKLTETLSGSDNVRVYDYNKRTIKIVVANKQKVNNFIFGQLASVIGYKLVGDEGVDCDQDNVYLFVDHTTLSVDTSATTKAINNLF